MLICPLKVLVMEVSFVTCAFESVSLCCDSSLDSCCLLCKGFSFGPYCCLCSSVPPEKGLQQVSLATEMLSAKFGICDIPKKSEAALSSHLVPPTEVKSKFHHCCSWALGAVWAVLLEMEQIYLMVSPGRTQEVSSECLQFSGALRVPAMQCCLSLCLAFTLIRIDFWWIWSWSGIFITDKMYGSQLKLWLPLLGVPVLSNTDADKSVIHWRSL